MKQATHVIIARAVGLSNDSTIQPYIATHEWYSQVPNWNDPFVLYASCVSEAEAHELLLQIPPTYGAAELWKQNRVLAGHSSTQTG